jgi:Fur family ferric uptake transcriptional regulator/Fur family peroxide stress response transcriptional regulator
MNKNQRTTKQKTKILETLRSADHHPTAEWVYQEVRKEIPGLSLGTVYRNLNQLRENGEIQELAIGSNQGRFDHLSHNHYHFCCSSCGKITDLPISVMKTLENKAKSLTKYKITGHRLDFFGQCDGCLSAD